MIFFNLPSSEIETLRKNLKQPKGSFTFDFKIGKGVFSKDGREITLVEISTGQQLYRLVRTRDMKIIFYHFSPGTGAREAVANLNNITPYYRLLFVLTWSTKEIRLLVTPYTKTLLGEHVVGGPSYQMYRPGTDGKVYNLGKDSRISRMAHFSLKGKILVQPTAIEVWDETLLAIDALNTGTSNDGLYSTIVANTSISMLISGFEAYTKRRFIELEEEGITPRVIKLIGAFYSAKERSTNLEQTIKDQAKEQNISILKLLIQKKTIGFQNFQKCKLAYNKAYRIQFGNIGVPSTLLEEMQKYFDYRHRIIHVHPAFGILNPHETPEKDAVYSDKELIDKGKALFDEFIKKLHLATLSLEK